MADARIALLGIDGIVVGADATVSPLDHAVDFSRACARGDGSKTAEELGIPIPYPTIRPLFVSLGRG